MAAATPTPAPGTAQATTQAPGTRPALVLIGHGMVGQRYLEALAELGATATHRITVLCEEPRPAYDRVHLTSYFSGSTPEDLSLTPASFMEEHGIALHLDDPAESIDREARTVTSRTGQVFPYDVLVLATGSYPFVPPVPGKDAPGCFVYRTIEDLLAIEEYAKTRTTGAVVGGGLLGLEAAGALKGLGLATRVVEFAPRLMPVQVDEGGGAALLRTIENMGLTVHTGVGTQEVLTSEDGSVSGMKLSDGSSVDTDLVVFSAGVRPRDQLARESGLTVGERGGISVDARCRTSDPHVYAIGECALASDGRVYGLVAPGYEMAETAAADLLGREKEFTGADLSTKLKLLGVDVASFGDAHGATAGSLDVVYSDSRSGVYKKVVVSAEGVLLGGVLVGDADSYGLLRPLTGSVPPVTPEQLVLPAGAGAPSRSARPRSGRRGDLLLPQRHQEGDHRPHHGARGQEVHQGGHRLRKLPQGDRPADAAGRRQGALRLLPLHPRRALRDRPHPARDLVREAPRQPRPRGGARRRGLRGLQAHRRFDHRLARPHPRSERLRPGRGAGRPPGHQRPLPGQHAAQRLVLGRAAHSRRRDHPRQAHRDR